ncbi:phosphotransferase enzyme family protein [Aspergillus filifer]
MTPLKSLRRVVRAALPRFHRMFLSTSPSRASIPPHPANFSDQHKDDILFFYNSGRWLWDEAAQLRKRYQPFNVEELKQTAAKSVNAEYCVNIINLPEGPCNRTFLLTMDNHVQLIAKISNPYIPQNHIPDPRIFAWSSKKDQPVGVEYIIMEKASGNELSKSWPTMDVSDKLDIVSQWANIQAKIAAVHFGHYGSLFYRNDIDGGINVPGIADQFCIGPSCDIQSWEEERRFMSEFRGPYEVRAKLGSSPGAYATAIARRERKWITRFANPRHLADRLRQSDSQESPGCHIKFLNRYLKVVPRLMPSYPGQNRSVLWRSDLHFGNIFVKGNEIVSIIDRQGCSSLPIFHACRIPKFLKVHGPLLFDLPGHLRRYQLTQLQKFYISKLRKIDNDVFSALSFPQALTRQQLIDFSAYTWHENPQSSCPVTSGIDELASHAAEEKSWEDLRDVETMRTLVSPVIDASDDKDGVRDALRACKLSDSGPASLSGNLI